MTKTPGSITVKTNVPESSQMSIYQNGALHSATDKLAITIDVCPYIQDHLQSEDEIKAYMEESFVSLSKLGWEVNVYIGKDCDHEDED